MQGVRTSQLTDSLTETTSYVGDAYLLAFACTHPDCPPDCPPDCKPPCQQHPKKLFGGPKGTGYVVYLPNELIDPFVPVLQWLDKAPLLGKVSGRSAFCIAEARMSSTNGRLCCTAAGPHPPSQPPDEHGEVPPPG